MKILWTRVSLEIAEIAKKLAETKGITLSEYIRHLIIDDIDSRLGFTSDSQYGARGRISSSGD